MTHNFRLHALTVEHRERPIDTSSLMPRFGWQAIGTDRYDAFQVQVDHQGEQVWDSGERRDVDTVDVAYAGAPLLSDADYTWRVRVWVDGSPRGWAESTFSTTLLHREDWTASWIAPHQSPTHPEHFTIMQIVQGALPSAPPVDRLEPPKHVRQNVDLAARAVRARLFASARGIFRPAVNGRELDERLFEPGFDSYASRLSFSTFDVTQLLHEGTNVIGMTVADGWWAGRVGITGSSAQWGDTLAVIWQLSVEYADGSRSVFGSGDTESRSMRGGWDYADIFIGERFDARKALDGWSVLDHDTELWEHTTLLAGEHDKLVPFAGEPVYRTEKRSALIGEPFDDGSILVDLGQVIAGRMRFAFRAGRGTEITIRHAEVLDAEGRLYDNVVGPNKEQTDVYVCQGHDDIWEPSFTFHGFRYALVSATAPFTIESAEGVVLGTALRRTSMLHTSDPLLDRLHENIVWSQRGNFLSIPTDCPQRERAGWTGDFQVFMPTATTNMDVRQFTERWLANLRAEQFDDGGVPVVIPSIPAMDRPRNPIQVAAGWSDAVVIVPWVLWERCADRRVLEDNYPAMRRWIEYQWAQARKELPERLSAANSTTAQRERHLRMWNNGWQFGDWLSPSSVKKSETGAQTHPGISNEIAAAAFHAHSTRLVSEAATILGEHADAAKFAERSQLIKEAFAHEYVSADGALLDPTQGAYVLALAFDLVPDPLRRRSIEHLVALVKENGELLDTGFLSTPHLLDVLWDAGERDLARTLLWQTQAPSWLYPVTSGATTVWEKWDAVAPDGTPSAVSMNHYAFGCVDDWIFRRQVGIASVAPGFGHVRFEPDLDGPLSEADATIETVRGAVAMCWKRTAEGTAISGRLPANVSGELVVSERTFLLEPGEFDIRLPY